MDVDELNKALESMGDVHDVDAETKSLFELKECLGFVLNQEYFAIPILKVEEIRRWEIPSKLPDTASYVKGVINIRGAIVPVIDLRERFIGVEQDYKSTTVVIVIRVFYPDKKDKIIGIVVDSVTNVIQYSDDNLKKMPEINESMAEGFISGILNHEENAYFMLKTDSLLNINQF